MVGELVRHFRHLTGLADRCGGKTHVLRWGLKIFRTWMGLEDSSSQANPCPASGEARA